MVCTGDCGSCETNEYWSNADIACIACGDNCETCDNDGCLQCISTYASILGTCELCVDGTRVDTDGTACESCPLGCETCNEEGCLSCTSDYTFIEPNICHNCAEGTYYEEGQCVQCDEGCDSCDA